MPSLLIESLEMKEFRGIRACEEPIELSNFTVLVGRNNSGKTAVLEALSLLPVFNFGQVRFPPVTWTWKDFMGILHGGLSSLIYGYAGEAVVRYVIRGKEVVQKFWPGGLTGPCHDGRPLSRGEMAGLLNVKNDEQLPTSVLLLPNDTRFLTELADSLRREDEWTKVEKSGANTAIVRDLITKTVHDRFTEATVRFNSIVLRKELRDGERVIYVKAKDLGDGIERILICGLWLETYKPRVVLWDDVETSAHPGLIEAVLEWLASRDWQVVLSTHSYDVLERLVAIEPEGASVVVLKKGSDDVLRPRVLSLDELGEKMRKHVDIRRVVDIL